MAIAESWGRLGRKYDFDELPFGKFATIARKYYPDWGEPLPTDDEGAPLVKYRVDYSYTVTREESEIVEAASPEQAKQLVKEEHGPSLDDFQIDGVTAV